MSTVRVPARVVDYMTDTSWGQGSEAVDDPARTALLAVLRGRRNADRSLSLSNPDEPILARLYFEAEHLADGLRYGDAEPDTLADYNAAMAMQRRVTSALGRPITYLDAQDLMQEAQG